MKHGYWTIIFEDKMIIKKTGEFSPTNCAAHKVDNGSVNWSDSKWNNIHAIQFTDDGVDNDQVEYTDSSPNGVYDASVLGDFRTQFIEPFDAVHLAQLQSEWDNNPQPIPEDASPDDMPPEETEAEKIARLGPRPTSYTS